MNNTIKELFNRKSVRAYTDEIITEEEKKIILASAIQAPTAGNMSLFSIIDIQSQETKDILAKRCDNQSFISKAPMVLVFLADFQKWFDMFQYYENDVPTLSEADMFLAMQDCIIAAQNAVVAAESLDIGSCYIGDILENFEENQKLLNLPRYAIPFVLVTFGKPTDQQINRIKPKRFNVEDIVFKDCYPNRTIEDVKDMFKRKLDMDDIELKDYISSYATRKFQAPFREEMNRSCKAIIESWKKEA